MPLRRFQTPHAVTLKTALLTHGFALDGSSPGTGKTYVACALAQKLGALPVVVCPAALVSHWWNVVTEFGLPAAVVTSYECARGNKAQTVRGCNTETPLLSAGMWQWGSFTQPTLLIFDEVHRCRSSSTHAGKLLLTCASKPSHVRVLMLSATCCDSIQYLPVVATLIGFCQEPHEFLTRPGAAAARAPEAAFREYAFPAHGSCMDIADLAEAMPQNQVVPHCYSVEKEVVQVINQQYQLLRAGGATVTARAAIELAKVPLLASLASDHLASGMSVLVFLNTTQGLQRLAALLGTSSVIIGGQRREQRDAIIHRFQTGEAKLLLAMIKTGGTGLNLHDTTGHHPRAVLLSPPWNAQDLVQALGRAYRVGSLSPVIQRLVYCDGTDEVAICAHLQDKFRWYGMYHEEDKGGAHDGATSEAHGGATSEAHDGTTSEAHGGATSEAHGGATSEAHGGTTSTEHPTEDDVL